MDGLYVCSSSKQWGIKEVAIPIMHRYPHCCYLRASVGIAMAILPLEGIYPQSKRAKVLFKTKTNNLPLICNSIFQTGRQWL